MEIFSDSRLVVGQVQGELEAKDVRMQEYLNQVKHLQLGFESFNLLHIPRSKNTHADSLATLATSLAQSLPRVILAKDLCKPTKMKKEVVYIHHNQMDSIVLFLKEDILPEEKSEADKVRRKAPQFWLSKDQKLYKRSFSRPYLLCIHLRHQSYFWRSYMNRFVETTQEADPCLTEPLLRDIGGQTCRKKHKNM